MTLGGVMLACVGCHTENRSHRGYCRACAAPLQPVCRGCRFINERGDRFCGGCGSGLVIEVQAEAATRSESRPAVRSELSELAELFAPVAQGTPDDALPAAGITQSDLDRLFGGPS